MSFSTIFFLPVSLVPPSSLPRSRPNALPRSEAPQSPRRRPLATRALRATGGGDPVSPRRPTPRGARSPPINPGSPPSRAAKRFSPLTPAAPSVAAAGVLARLHRASLLDLLLARTPWLLKRLPACTSAGALRLPEGTPEPSVAVSWAAPGAVSLRSVRDVGCARPVHNTRQRWLLNRITHRSHERLSHDKSREESNPLLRTQHIKINA